MRYGTPRAAALAGSWMTAIQNAAYLASAELAAEKGAFPLFDAKRFLASPNVAALDEPVRAAIRRHGIRNGCLTSIAPTGTISLLAGNVSSGIEPVFDFLYRRRVLDRRAAPRTRRRSRTTRTRCSPAVRRRRAAARSFVRAGEIDPTSSTRRCRRPCSRTSTAPSPRPSMPEDIGFEAFKDVYLEAHALGLKGCTTYRPNPVTGAVLQPAEMLLRSPRCSRHRGTAAPTPEAKRAAAKPADTPLRGGSASRRGTRRRRLHGAAARARGRALGLHLQAQVAGQRPRHLRDHQRHRAQRARARPFEIFINTRNLEHYAWTVALTRMISAVFRRGGDVTFVAEELKAVFDPQGGQWVAGRYVPSLLAAIGEVIETHMIRTGFLQGETHGYRLVNSAPRGFRGPARHAGERRARKRATERPARLKLCPRCSSADYVQREGCWVSDCGFSRCG